MNANDPSLAPLYRLSDPRQTRTYERLARLVGPGPAAFFLDACRLMEEGKPFQSTTHLVAHLLREIESALRDVLEPISRWPERKKATKNNSKEAHADEVLCVLAALDIPEGDPVAKAWLGLTNQSAEGALHRRAHRSSLMAARPLDAPFLEFWESMQVVLDLVLTRLESKFLAYREKLDKLLAKDAPDANDIALLRGNIPNSLITWQYFFAELRSPLWVKPLREAGVFEEIPEPLEVEGGISCPPWPAADYLQRSLTKVSDEISSILDDAPLTDNWRAVYQLADFACQLPVDTAIRWTVKTIPWLESEQFMGFGLPRRLAELAQSLARRSASETALKLLRALLAILPDRSKEDDGVPPLSNSREPRPRMDLWEYEQILSTTIPSLVAVAGIETLLLFCDLLDQSITLSDRRGTKRQPEDLSQLWRHAIEEHPQNFRSSGLKTELVRAVRDTAEQIVQRDPSLLPEVIDILERKGEFWKVFRRIALHLLRVAPDTPFDIVRTRLLNRSLFESADTRHEYIILEKQRFGQLVQSDQETIFGWIEGGPLKCEETLKAWQEYRQQPTTEEIRAQYIAEWKLNQLAPLEEFLNEKQKREFAILSDHHGVPEHPEFTSYTRDASFGAHSPVTADELSVLTVAELVSYLTSWAPGEDQVRGATPEGLGRDLRTIVGTKPGIYANAAAEFTEISEPTYIRAIIEGLHGALKEDRPFDWAPVIDLCVWAAGRERAIPGRTAENYFLQADQDWGGARAAIARLLNNGFTAKSNGIPFELRDKVWQAIEPITHDPDPDDTPNVAALDEGDTESFKAGRSIKRSVHLLSDAINSVRGSIMETVIRYAGWVQIKGKKGGSGSIEAKRGFEAMPEARTVLERHLDASVDDSPTIRSVYGEYFSALADIDRSWLETQIPVILPREKPALWHAAWDAYLGCCLPVEELFARMKDDYAFAIQQIGTESGGGALETTANHPLISHLMILYWRGYLDLRGGLLEDFYSRASAAMRGRALNYVGWSLRYWKGSISAQQSVRLKELLEWRVESSENDKNGTAEELKEFGWWFVSEKFDDLWSIVQLQRVLSQTGQAFPTHLVVERLATLSSSMPLETLNALRAIVEGGTDQWEIIGWIEFAKTIVRNALNSTDAEAIKEATDLSNVLGSRGHFLFLELLKASTTQ
jgi:hypothetical protein